MICEGCKFAKRYPKPREEPQKPANGIWGLIFQDIGVSTQYDYWRYETKMHEGFVKCLRFPEAVRKPKDSHCGEYDPAPHPTRGRKHER